MYPEIKALMLLPVRYPKLLTGIIVGTARPIMAELTAACLWRGPDTGRPLRL
jgi:hypothetical protein